MSELVSGGKPSADTRHGALGASPAPRAFLGAGAMTAGGGRKLPGQEADGRPAGPLPAVGRRRRRELSRERPSVDAQRSSGFPRPTSPRSLADFAPKAPPPFRVSPRQARGVARASLELEISRVFPEPLCFARASPCATLRPAWRSRGRARNPSPFLGRILSVPESQGRFQGQLGAGLCRLFCEGPDRKSARFAGHGVSAASLQLRCRSLRAATGTR